MNENGFLDFIFMFIMVRLLFIFFFIFTASHASTPHQLFKPHFARRLSTLAIQNTPSVAIMGHHLCYKAEPHSRVDDREPRNSLWKPLRASSTFVMNFDENSLTPGPVFAYQVTDKYCIHYEKGQKLKFIQLLPFGNKQRVKEDFKWFQKNKYDDEYLKHMSWTHIRKYLYSLNLFEIDDTSSEKNIELVKDQARALLPGVQFITDITQLKTIPLFDRGDLLRFTSLPRPIIPDIPFIMDPKDILEIARFHKDFCNYMEYHFCLTQETIPLYLQTFIYAVKKEPSRLLYLVRSDPSGNYNTATRINRLKAYSLLREDRGDLLFQLFNFDYKDASFNVDEIKRLWKIYFKEQSENWFDEHEDLFRACFNFAEMIWKHFYSGYREKLGEVYKQNYGKKTRLPKGARSYEAAKEFEEDLVSVDPDFKYVIEQSYKKVPSQNDSVGFY